MSQTVKFQLGGVLTFVTEPSRAGVWITLRYRNFTIKARGEDMSYTLPDGNQVELRITYQDAQGNEAEVDGDVSWTSSDENIATVTADPTDSQTATVAATQGGSIGQVQITATADADLGEGTRELICTMDVTVVAGEAVSGTIAPVGGYVPIP